MPHQVLELAPQVLGDQLPAGQDRDVLEERSIRSGFATKYGLSEARSNCTPPDHLEVSL